MKKVLVSLFVLTFSFPAIGSDYCFRDGQNQLICKNMPSVQFVKMDDKMIPLPPRYYGYPSYHSFPHRPHRHRDIWTLEKDMKK